MLRRRLLDINVQNHFKIYPSSTSDHKSDSQDHIIQITLDQLQADLRNIAFHYRKKTGFPHLEDSGIADVSTGDQGITVKIIIDFAPETGGGNSGTVAEGLFKVVSVDVEIRKLTFNIRKV